MEAALADYLAHAPVFVRTPAGVITHWTQGAEELYGYSWSEAEGRSSHELLRTRFPAPLQEIDRLLEEEGQWQGLLGHTKRDGSEIWTESVWRMRRDAEGASGRVVEINTDVTHRELLRLEVDHRVKNTLATVQAIARLSLRRSDPTDYSAFETRLVALSRAHDLLAQRAWRRADLREVLARVLDAFGVGDRVDIEGEATMLSPSSVIAYSLAFHELATNALKHGALSADAGRVAVSWERLGPAKEKIHLVWREVGGPPVVPPADRGFGSRLIERAVSAELGEPVELRFPREGLVCEFDGPVQKTLEV